MKGAGAVAVTARAAGGADTDYLHLTGRQVPATVAVGDRFRFVAGVIEFNTAQCLFRLAPVSAETR